MDVKTGKLDGLLVIKPEVFQDRRGCFFESYHLKRYSEAGLNVSFVQENESFSHRNVLRGLHFQLPPFAQGKLVRVIRGAVLDVALDLRKNSPTYGLAETIVLSENNKLQLWIPPGFAHGFLTLEDDTLFLYKCTDYYNKESECAILWNDPDLDIPWNIENPVVSDKDNQAMLFKDFKSPFLK